jgi:hypothetical protein
VLTDLATLSDLVNGTLLPLINVLASTALGNSPVGIAGSTIYSDITDESDTFYNSVASVPLVVADSLRVLRALIAQLQTQVGNIAIEIATLTSQSSSINPNDIAASLASIVSQIAALTSSVSNLALEISSIQAAAVQGNVVATGNIPASTIQEVTVNLPTTYSDNNYTAILSMQEGTGQLQILSFTYQPAGVGVIALVKNTSTTAALSGFIHLIAKHF